MIDKGRAGRGKHNLNAELKSGTLAALSKYTVYTLPAVRTATEIQPKHFCPLLNPGPSSGLAMSVARPSRSSQNPPQNDIRIVHGFSGSIIGCRAEDLKGEAEIENPSDLIVAIGVDPELC